MQSPEYFGSARRFVFTTVLGLCLIILLAGVYGCGKKTIAPSRYGGSTATGTQPQPEVWSPPPQPEVQAQERDLRAGSTPQQPVAPMYGTPEAETVPVYKDVYQLASFSTQEHAQQFMRRARDAGFTPDIEDAVIGGQTYYRVIGSIQGTDAEIRQAVTTLGVNPVQRSHDRVQGRPAMSPGMQTSTSAAGDPRMSVDALAAEIGSSSETFPMSGENASTPLFSGSPAPMESESPLNAGEQPDFPMQDSAQASSQSQSDLGPSYYNEEQPAPQDPMLGPTYRAPMSQADKTQSQTAMVDSNSASVSKRAVSSPQSTPTTTRPKSSIIPPSAPSFVGSPTCQEKNGRIMASAVGRAEEPLRAERIAVDQAKRSLLLCVQAYREEKGLASSGPRLTSLPVNYLEISDPQRRPDGSVFVSVGIAVDDIPKLTADR